MGIQRNSYPYALPNATFQDVEMETQLNNNGVAGYGPWIRPDGRFLRKNFPVDEPVNYTGAEVGDAKAYSVYTETYDNGSSRTYTKHTPFGADVVTTTGDVEDAERVESQEISEPFEADDVLAAANFSGTWTTVTGNGDIGVPSNGGGIPLVHGTTVKGTAAGMYFALAPVSDFPSFNCRVKKTRYRIKYAKHGAVGGAIRLKILKHRLNPGKSHNISSVYNMHGLSNYPTGTARSGTHRSLWDWSYTIGPVGQIVSPSVTGPDVEFSVFGIGATACIQTLGGTKLDNPGLFMMFGSSSIQENVIGVPYDQSQIGEYNTTAWTEISTSGWDTHFYIFMFDYPYREI